jgi:acetylornithine deacetylase/succinyl-diaminopimelate desuccinylase-like protein
MTGELTTLTMDGAIADFTLLVSDSCMTALRCPTSMVFVPSKDGVSHNPVEYTSPEDCAIGAQVILGALLRFDELRARKVLGA